MSSASDSGTPFQLRNLLNRKNIGISPKKDVNSREDFFHLVVGAHVLVAAMEFLGMDSLDDNPNAEISKRSGKKSYCQFVVALSKNSQTLAQSNPSRILTLLMSQKIPTTIRVKTTIWCYLMPRKSYLLVFCIKKL